MKRITIKDIAKDCDISIAAVSYVINKKFDKVSTETIKIVNESIKNLGYIPSINAQSLVGKGSKLIGVIIPQLDVSDKMIFANPFYSEFISGIEHKLRMNGYSIVLSILNQEDGIDNMLRKWNLDGAIILGLDEINKLNDIRNVEIPTILIDSYLNDDNFFRINIDDEDASFEATQFLINKGHESIAFVTGKLTGYGVLQKRYLGYKRALEKNNLKYTSNLLVEEDITYEHGIKAAEKIINETEATAVIATADIIAMGLINGFKINKKRVPKDYSVMGFDDTYLATMLQPKLTTVHQNISGRGEFAAELILKIIRGELVKKYICTKTKIVERNTTGRYFKNI